MRLEDGLEVAHVLRAAGKGGGDEINALGQAELDILAVLVGDELHVQLDAGYVDGLAVGQRAAVERLAHNVGAVFDLHHVERHQAVVDQDAGAGLDVVRQAVIGDGNDRIVAFDIAGGQGEFLPLHDFDFAVLVCLGPDLRPLGIEHDADRHAKRRARGLYGVHARLVLLVGAVAEVHTGNVHARLNHFGQDRVGRGAERANNLCFTHRNKILSLQIAFYTLIYF